VNILRSEAIVLRRRDFKERDLLVTLLTRDRGRLDGVAKGARALTGRGAASFQALTHGMVFFGEKPAGGLVSIRKLDPLPPHFTLQPDYDGFLLASYFSEWLMLCEVSPADAERWFLLLLGGLEQCLEAVTQPDSANPGAHAQHNPEKPQDADPEIGTKAHRLALARLEFELNLLDCLGVQPKWSRCVGCGRVLFSGGPGRWAPAEPGPFQLDAPSGVRCPTCALPPHGRGSRHAFPLTAAELGLIGALRDPDRMEPPPPAPGALAGLERAVTGFLEFHAGRLPRSLALLPPSSSPKNS